MIFIPWQIRQKRVLIIGPKSEGSSYRLSLSAAYNKAFGSDHLLSAFARYSINESANNLTSISMKGFPNDN